MQPYPASSASQVPEGGLSVRLACVHPCSRPTAVNLADGLDRVKASAQAAAAQPGATPASVVEAVVKTAEEYFDADITCNRVRASQ